MHHQVVSHQGQWFVASGIATGMSPGVFIANIYLAEVDELVLADPRLQF